MVHSSKDSSSDYDILSTSTENCQICWRLNNLSHEIISPCGHSYCKDCLYQYYQSCLNSFKLHPFLCPTCYSDMHEVLSKVLEKAEYKRYSKLKKRLNLIRDPTVVWCPIVNCEGFGRNEQGIEPKCNNCDYLIPLTQDPPLDQIEKLSLVQCPSCKAWISRIFGCMVLKCYCGCKFCCKCKSDDLEAHAIWKCFSDDENGRTSYLLIFFSVLLYVFFPFLPVIFVYWYRKYWDRHYFEFVNEFPRFYFLVLTLVSPVILVFSLFYLPIGWGFLCVDAVFSSQVRPISRFWIFLKVLIYIPSVFLVFLGWLLLLGLLIAFAPMFGLTLLGYELLESYKV